jgi:hypothetical protein
MRIRIFYPLIIILLFLSSFQTPNEDKIIWTETRLLTWNDFKASPDMKSNKSAISSTGIMVDFGHEEQNIILIVVAQFIKSASWTKDCTENLLNHEQGHFNISEIYARKLRTKLKKKKLRRSNYGKVIQEAYNTIENEMVSLQNEYDSSTKHGTLLNEQKRWELKITELLNKSSMESGKTSITLKLK